MLNKFLITILFLTALKNVSAATANNNFNVGISVPTFCKVTTSNLNFSTYDPSQDKNATSNIQVICSVDTAYTVKLSTGYSTNYINREMKSENSKNYQTSKVKIENNVLRYNIYTTSEHTSIWGDGKHGTSEISGIGNGQTITHFVHGKIPKDQNVSPGIYTDTITVTVTY